MANVRGDMVTDHEEIIDNFIKSTKLLCTKSIIKDSAKEGT